MPQKCPQCGASLPTGALAGLCPACLLQQGAAADTATGPSAKPFVPPTVKEVARLFPQLEILDFLGKGGMGAVYKARQPALDRFVALKILPAQVVAPDPGFADRFTREARALARLSHPNIVAVHEFGQVAPTALPYFIMEFVDGVNLRQLQKSGRLSPREALQIVPQICDALQYAHDEGVVHRDIKPENVLVDRKGRVKIADFGLAKILGRDLESLRLTGEGQVMGTPHYMAPEQIEHPLTVDHRADIFSLGVVFYEMLTGELPLGKFQPPSRKVQVDVRLDDVVLHALEKEPERRYQQVSQVKTAVTTIANSAATAATASNSTRAVPKPLRLWIGVAIPFVLAPQVLVWAIRAIHRNDIPAAMFLSICVVGLIIIAYQRVRAALAPPRSGARGWKIVAGVILAAVVLNCVIAFLALRPTHSKSPAPPFTEEVPRYKGGTGRGEAVTPRPAKSGRKPDSQPLSGVATSALTIAPESEGLLGDIHTHDAPELLSLETGRLVTMRDLFGSRSLNDFSNDSKQRALLRSAKIDIGGNAASEPPGVVVWDCAVGTVGESGWDLADRPDEKQAGWDNKSLADILKALPPARPDAFNVLSGDPPQNWLLRTRAGAFVVLQLTGFSKNPPGVKLRYRLVQSPGPGPGIASARSHSTPPTEAATPEQPAEAPTLRFVAWQDEWQTNQPGAAQHPDGSPVIDPTELNWLRHVQPTRYDVSRLNLKPEPRFLHLWFSHPAAERVECDEVSVLDARGATLPLTGRYGGITQLREPDDISGNLGWLIITLGRIGETNLPSRVTVRLCYPAGALERVQELVVTPNRGVEMSLAGGSLLNGYGQDVDGQAFVSIAVDVEHTRSQRFDVIAVAKDGREIPSKGVGRSGLVGSPFGVAQFEFPLPLAEVAKFLIGTRPLRTNEWSDVMLPESSSSGTTNERARSVASAPFIARLPQGQIELIAISRHPSENQPWWRADGTTWTNAAFENKFQHSSYIHNGQRFEFVFQRRGLPNDTTLDYSFEPKALELDSGDQPLRQGKALPDHNMAVVLLPESAKEVTIKLGVAAGEWKTMAKRTPQAGGGASFTLGKQTCTALFLDPVESGRETRVAVSYNKVPGWTTRVTALDTRGQVYVSFPYGQSVDAVASVEGRFKGLPLSQVELFRFEARPFKWVEFRNVSLEPDRPTQVEIVDAGTK